MMLMLNVHPSRSADLLSPDRVQFSEPITATEYRDGFGNVCTRIVAPSGRLTIANEFTVQDSGEPDETAPGAVQHPVEELPDDVLVFLLGSRYCETDRLSEAAWSLFGHGPGGWPLVQAITDYVHQHIAFSHDAARTRPSPARPARSPDVSPVRRRP